MTRETEGVPAVAGRTFDDLLSMLARADDGLTLDLDPALVVGELRGKVDSIKYVVDRMEGLAAYHKALADAHAAKRKSVETNLARLKAYVTSQMEAFGFDKVPGDEWRVQLQANPPALEILEAPTEKHREQYPTYTETVTEIRWRHDRLKLDLQSGALQEWECPFAKITQGRRAQFYVNTPAKLPAKPKAAKKGKK